MVYELFTSLLACRHMSMFNEFQTMSKSYVVLAEQDVQVTSFFKIVFFLFLYTYVVKIDEVFGKEWAVWT
jgi:hypothetical protein